MNKAGIVTIVCCPLVVAVDVADQRVNKWNTYDNVLLARANLHKHNKKRQGIKRDLKCLFALEHNKLYIRVKTVSNVVRMLIHIL